MKKIFNKTCVNKTTQLVVSNNIDAKSTFICGDNICSMVPLPTKIYKSTNMDTDKDLTGVKFGRFVVIGVSLWVPKKNRRRWVAKCKCGRYQIFSTKAIKTHMNLGIDCLKCVECNKTENLIFYYNKRISGENRN